MGTVGYAIDCSHSVSQAENAQPEISHAACSIQLKEFKKPLISAVDSPDFPVNRMQ